MQPLIRLATRRPVAVSVLAAAIVVLGWVAWGDLPLDLLPDIESPTIVVSLRSGDRPPTEMERVYGEVVERQLFAVRGLRDLAQVARTGRLVSTVTFQWDADMDLALVDVEKALGPLRSDPDVDEVLVRRFDPRQSPVLSIGLTAPGGTTQLADLKRIAERQVATSLERLEGVAEARVLGGREREVRVDVRRSSLDAHGVTLAKLESRLSAANFDVNAGTLEEGSKVFLVRGLARYRTAEDVAAVVVHYQPLPSGGSLPVHVRDLADVHEADAEISHLVRVNGIEGVSLSVYKEAGANTVEVSRRVHEAMEGLSADLPGVETTWVSDQAALVEDAISDVQQAALLGLLLAIVVLILFLRAVGPTIVVSIAIPVSLLATMFFMHLSDRSLNIMTLAGLALGVGMLVDNAIVVVESIFRRLSEGDAPKEAAARGTSDVAGAIISSTLTTCAVFLPVLFVQGLAARLVSGLSFTVVTSLLASLAVALFLIPALSVWFLPKTRTKAVDPGRGLLERFVLKILKVSPLVVIATAVLVVFAILGMLRLGGELLPPADPRQLSLRVVGPPGTRVESTAETVAAVEAILAKSAGEDLAATLSEVGRLPEDDRTVRTEQTEENTARITVRLTDGGRGADRIADSAQAAVASLYGLETTWEVGDSALSQALGRTGPPVEVEISGRSLEDLRQAAAIIRERFVKESALWNVRTSFEGGPPEIRVVLRRSVAEGLGIDLAVVARTLEAALDGRRATVLSTGDEEKDVVIHLPEPRLETLAQLPVESADGARVALGAIAELIPAAGAREIFRRDQRRVATVTARIAPNRDYPEAISAATAALADVDLPAGLRARLVGEEQERAETFNELKLAGILAMLLVFMVLAGSFESLIHPLTVITAVPIAWLGVAGVLLTLGNPIGVMELLGMIVLTGIAVNDAILLVDTARRGIASGLQLDAALARAASIRLRPILMTSATTILALLPLALGSGEAAELRRPMAWTIIGGLVASTIGSLLITPAVYRLLDGLSRRRTEEV